MVRAEGVLWELGTGLGNPGGFSKFFGMVPARAARGPGGAPSRSGDLLRQGLGSRCWREGEQKRRRNAREGGGKEDYKD